MKWGLAISCLSNEIFSLVGLMKVIFDTGVAYVRNVSHLVIVMCEVWNACHNATMQPVVYA